STYHEPDLAETYHSFPTRRSSDLNGSGVGDVYLNFSDAEAVYLAAWVKHNRGFEWHPISQKMAFFWDSRGNYILLQSRYAGEFLDRKSTRLNSSHVKISYAVFCLK